MDYNFNGLEYNGNIVSVAVVDDNEVESVIVLAVRETEVDQGTGATIVKLYNNDILLVRDAQNKYSNVKSMEREIERIKNKIKVMQDGN